MKNFQEIRNQLSEGKEEYVMKKGTYTRKVDGKTADKMKKQGWKLVAKEEVEENKILGGDTNFKVVEVKSGMIRLEFVNVRNGDILMKKDDFKKLQKFIKTVKV